MCPLRTMRVTKRWSAVLGLAVGAAAGATLEPFSDSSSARQSLVTANLGVNGGHGRSAEVRTALVAAGFPAAYPTAGAAVGTPGARAAADRAPRRQNPRARP